MKTQRDRIEKLWKSPYSEWERLIYEWVKTGKVNLREFRELIGEMFKKLDS